MPPMRDRVDPQMVPVLDALKDLGFDVDLNDIPATRDRLAAIAAQMAAGAPPIEGVELSVLAAPYADGSFNVPLRVTRPAANTEALPVMYWMHGGGYVLGKAADDDALMAYFSLTLNCVAVSVDYRLAPENPFPVPLEDCYVGLKWTHDNAAALNIDPHRIMIAGQSAGAGLTAALAQVTRDRGEVPLIYQLLVYPMLDDRNLAQASDTVADTLVWSRYSNLIGWRSYLGMEPGTEATPRYAAPGRTADLAGLPPVYLLVGDVDLFLVENLDYAARLIQAGVPTEVHVYPGGVHAFDTLGAGTALAQRCNADRDRALKQALHG